jgi:subtilisin family serine protease
LKWINFGGVDPVAQNQGAATIFGQPTARGALALGAVPYWTPTIPEAFTAWGGNIPILFDSNGTRLPVPELRFKPEVVAPDNVDTTFFVPGYDPDGDGWPNFPGTSAAAPHAAGAVALLWQQSPSTTIPEMTQHLEKTALDIGASGRDDITGYGLIQLEPIVPEGGKAGKNLIGRYLPQRWITEQTSTGPVYTGNITIFNRTGKNISGPLEAAILNLPLGVTVENASGYTSSGVPFLLLPGNGSLPNNEPVRLRIRLRNPFQLPLGTFYTGFLIQLVPQGG